MRGPASRGRAVALAGDDAASRRRAGKHAGGRAGRAVGVKSESVRAGPGSTRKAVMRPGGQREASEASGCGESRLGALTSELCTVMGKGGAARRAVSAAQHLAGQQALSKVAVVAARAVVGIRPCGDLKMRETGCGEGWLDLKRGNERILKESFTGMNARKSYPNFLRKPSKHVLLNIRLSISSTLATEQQDSVSCLTT